MQCEQIDVRLGNRRFDVVELDPLPVAAGFRGSLVPCLIHEYSPHRFGGRGEEMPSAVPRRRLRLRRSPTKRSTPHAREPSLATFAPASPAQLLAREPSQFVVDQWQELLRRPGIAQFDSREYAGTSLISSAPEAGLAQGRPR